MAISNMLSVSFKEIELYINQQLLIRKYITNKLTRSFYAIELYLN